MQTHAGGGPHGGDALVTAVEAAGGRRTALLEARCLAAAAWAAHGGCGGFWAALLRQAHHVSLAVEQRPISLGPEGPLVQVVDFAGQPEYFCCHPEFFAAYGVLYVVVCPLVAAADEGHGDVNPNEKWDRSSVAYRERMRPWLALLHSSPVGQYHELQRNNKLPPNTVVLTSFVDKAREMGRGWRGVVEEVVRQSWGTPYMQQVPLANVGLPMLVDYEGDVNDGEVLDRLLRLRSTLAQRCRAVVEKTEHPKAFVQLRTTVFQAPHCQVNEFGHLWPLEQLKNHCLSHTDWVSRATTREMALASVIEFGLELLESTGDVKMLTMDGERLVLIDPIEAMSKLLCGFVPGRHGCQCRHCRQQEKTIALEEPSHQGWLRRSVAKSLLEENMRCIGIRLGKRGSAAAVEVMKAFDLCYETSSLPRAPEVPKPLPGLRHCSEPQQACTEDPFLAFPIRMGRPQAGQCFGNAVAEALRQGSLAVCLCLSFERTELRTFSPSVVSRLQCWLARQEQAATAPVNAPAYMRSCRGLAHLAAGGGTSAYLELAEHDRQTLFLASFGPAAVKIATAFVAAVKRDLTGRFQIESLCPLCIGALGKKEGALACGFCAKLKHEKGKIEIVSWYSKCIAGHDVVQRPSIAFTVAPTTEPTLIGGGYWAAAIELDRRIAANLGPKKIQEFVEFCGVKHKGKDCEILDENEQECHRDHSGPVFAVLVAVENAGGDREQLTAARDARQLQHILQKIYGSRLQCSVLLSWNNDKVSSVGVFEKLFKAVQGANDTPGAQVLFYYAGHAECRDGTGYLMMASGCTDLAMAQVFLAHKQANVPMVAILDACHSSVVLRNTFQQHHENPMAVPRLTVLCASEDNNAALEVDGKGIFTSCLVDVLKGCAKMPKHAEDVGRAVESKMEEEIRRLKEEGRIDKKCRQVPCLASFPLGSSEDVRRRLCFTFGPRRESVE